ncbi:MAG: hypothetical protein M3Y72_03775 [Acidobacteriota bacterium]|nr:hypothetical protein [Acidobacteriota bacterium]
MHGSANERVYHYSVRLLQLQLPRYSRQELRTAHTAAMAAARVFALNREHSLQLSRAGTALPTSPEAPVKSNRQFVMPELAAVQPVRQTLIQPDVPPNMRLKYEVPLPNLVLLNEDELPPLPAKRFVAPSVRAIHAKTTTPTLASAPVLTSDLALSSMKLASSVTELVHLPVPTSLAAPVRTYTVRPATAAHVAFNAGAAPNISVISITDNPVVPNEVLALPAANQIAAGGALQTGSERQGTSPLAGVGAASRGGAVSGTGSGADARNNIDEKSSAALGAGSLSGPVVLAKGGVAGSGDRAGVGLSTVDVNNGGTGTSLNAGIVGTIKMTLPKDGKFGVVVLGSAAASPYPGTEGALSGKMVYTVYVRVGQRKNWILQYCLAKSAVTRNHVQGTQTPLDAPWPYVVLRPEHPLDSNYVLVHGTISADGNFEQLALLFPSELEQKELLLRSLNQWAFRPAKRDGEPTAVEVLLIIPRETE